MALEEEKAWLNAELAGGGNAKEVDEAMDDVNEDVVVNDADDNPEDDSSDIECQCCFADYSFVRTSLLYSVFYPDLLSASPKWFNAPKLTFSAQPVSQPTRPPN
jgi:hypothetical protein